ncbi:hypothetical protein I601_0502 [Nocardioides dokdonensis FR1436]|uniref:Alpha-amylase n=1 Tax=Nocardioides dokdonensis FR1436 TaxID=1300347 RepID=A0A1A9GFD0_9ACTN|nr:carboxypeptidase-like regulatory domain-containing protein [Nocardioides dokdonensis]ANH36954.1 hypothetical protein I601_0502 [Nocardioides dokdonensis FR1436]
MGPLHPHRRQRPLLAALVAALTGAILLGAPAPAALAADPAPTLQPGRAAAEREGRVAARQAPTTAERTTKVRGSIKAADKGVKYRVRWFTKDWTYIDERKVTGGIYSLSLRPGTYYLQFVDLRPAYNVAKYAPTDIKVKVGNRSVQKNVRMKRGAAITGTVRAGGKVAGGAEVVAANAAEQSYRVTANKRGQFALGGLPAGSYSLFTYDRKKQYVGRSTYLAGMRLGQVRNTPITLGTRAGRLLVDLRTTDGTVKEKVFVTAVSKATGQFWTVKARGGEAIFAGLFPGKYRMVAPGVGSYLPQDGAIKGARVKSGKDDLASSFTWTKRGATITGAVIDEEHPDAPMEDVQVLAYAASGGLLGSATTDADGLFTITGAITTQPDVTVKIQPGGNNPPYLQGTFYCKYGTASLPGVSVRTGEDTVVGILALPQLPTAQQDNRSNCGPDATAPRAVPRSPR